MGRKTSVGSYFSGCLLYTSIDMNLPGFKKDEVEIQLQDGCLTVSAAKGLDKDCLLYTSRCV